MARENAGADKKSTLVEKGGESICARAAGHLIKRMVFAQVVEDDVRIKLEKGLQ